MREKQRQERKREQVLSALRERGFNGITNAELSTISLRYGAHLGTLYQLGYKIFKESLGEGLFKYTLLEEPSKDYKGKQKAMDALKEALSQHVDVDKVEEVMNNLGITVRYKAGTYNV